MRITTATILATAVGFDTIIQGAYNLATPWWPTIATEVPSSARGNVYGWMAKIPRMREWIGERVVQNIAARSQFIENKDYELTIGIDKFNLQDDNLGVYNVALEMLGSQAKLYPDDLISALLKAGEATAAWDGQNFFDPNHPVNTDDVSLGVYSNLYTGSALTAATYDAVYSAMAAIRGEDNKPLRVIPTHMIVPPQLKTQAKTIVKASTIQQGGAAVDNIRQGEVEIIVVPDLADRPTEWYLADLAKPIKPLVFQNRMSPEFAYMTDITNENVFLRKEFIYGAEARGAAAYALPFLIAKARP
jgi:phage major head subunit gpT-like protein